MCINKYIIIKYIYIYIYIYEREKEKSREPEREREKEHAQTISHGVLEYRIFLKFEYGFCFYSYAKYISLISKRLEQCHESLFG